jgi:hypothetical protein
MKPGHRIGFFQTESAQHGFIACDINPCQSICATQTLVMINFATT